MLIMPTLFSGFRQLLCLSNDLVSQKHGDFNFLSICRPPFPVNYIYSQNSQQ